MQPENPLWARTGFDNAIERLTLVAQITEGLFAENMHDLTIKSNYSRLLVHLGNLPSHVYGNGEIYDEIERILYTADVENNFRSVCIKIALVVLRPIPKLQMEELVKALFKQP